MTKLYHRDVFMPDGSLTDFIDRKWNLAYTRHALREAVKDKLGLITHAPRSVYFYADDVVEIERDCKNGVPTKIVVRVDYDNERDLILVLRGFDDGAAFVVTCWTNRVNDTHRTLNRSKYATS